MVRQAPDIYREVHSLKDIREINREIRDEMTSVRNREQLTELKKRSDYLCTLTFAPSWREKFGAKSRRFLEVAREEDEKTTKKANVMTRRKGFGPEYHPWRGG